MQLLRRLGLGLISVFLMVGCAQSTPEPVHITLDMAEYKFEPVQIEAKVGQEVTLELVNSGMLAHEIMFGRNVVRENNRPHGYETDLFATAHIEPRLSHPDGSPIASVHGAGHQGFMAVLEKTGDRALLSFEVTKAMVGEWEMGCFEQDGVHYDAGMVGTFSVTP